MGSSGAWGRIKLINYCKGLVARGSVHRFTVPRQQDWLFRRETGFLGPATSDAEEVQVSQQAIPVVYLLHGSKGVSPEDCLIFHCHGGGYLSSTFRSHEAYLRGWGERTRIPIHCTDYRLSPEHPFPASIQDLLDTYLFVTSGSEEAVRLLGFQPKRIILTGDSAGGNMALVLALAISGLPPVDVPSDGEADARVLLLQSAHQSQEFADLKHLPLYITAAKFDPLMDDAVAIARCWRGPLTIDLAKRMPHSFMSSGCEIPDVEARLDGHRVSDQQNRSGARTLGQVSRIRPSYTRFPQLVLSSESITMSALQPASVPPCMRV